MTNDHDIANRIRTTPPRTPNPNTTTTVITTTARLFGITTNDLTGPGRQRHLVDARQVAMAVLRATTTLSYPDIGRLFQRDHTTVIHAVQRVLSHDAMRAWAAAVDLELTNPASPERGGGCRRTTTTTPQQHHGGRR